MQKYTIAGIVAVALAITCMGAYVLSLDLSAVSGRSHSLPPESMSPHPFTVEDLVTLQKVRSPSPSPDGAWIVFPLRSNALVAGRELMNLWIVGSDGSNPRQLTFQPGDDSNLVWSSDGSAIYYLSTRSGSSQVWKVSPSGQDAVQITDFPLDVAHLKISPDGTSLAFSMAVFPGTNSTATAGRVARIAGQNASGQIYDRLPIRHWDAWEDGRRNHIFVMPLSTHVPVDVMQAMDADSPTKPFGSAGEYTFTPDSTGIIFSAADTGRAEAWSTGHNLYLSPASGMGAIINLTQENHAWATGPVFSPDGRVLVYRSMIRPGYESDRYRIMLRSWPDGSDREVAPGWDRSPESLEWSQDGKTLYVTAMDNGTRALFAIDPATGEARRLIGNGSVSSVSRAGSSLIFLYANMTAPADLCSFYPESDHPISLLETHRNRMAQVQMGEFEQFSFSGWNNETVHGYVVKPVGFDGTKRYPVALLIHGGPQGSFFNDFNYRWNPQVFAGHGYAVVMIDFHGSTGYGQAFTDSVRDDWGGKPFVDLQMGLDTALARYTWMDGNRVSALGGSYGGYMVDWIAGVWPDRFRCLSPRDLQCLPLSSEKASPADSCISLMRITGYKNLRTASCGTIRSLTGWTSGAGIRLYRQAADGVHPGTGVNKKADPFHRPGNGGSMPGDCALPGQARSRYT